MDTNDDLRISPQALRAQAAAAETAGFDRLAENLRRAAELTAVPDEELLQMYALLRPGRGTQAELAALGERLEVEYHASLTAALVREAGQSYGERRLLRSD